MWKVLQPMLHSNFDQTVAEHIYLTPMLGHSMLEMSSRGQYEAHSYLQRPQAISTYTGKEDTELKQTVKTLMS